MNRQTQLSVAALLICSIQGASGEAQDDRTTREWLDRIPHHLSFEDHLGKSGLRRCIVILSPSDKNGVIGVIQRPKGLLERETLASIHLLPTDKLVGSTRFPGSPFESNEVISLGYESGGTTSSLVIEDRRARKIITIELKNGNDLKSVSCSVGTH